jgi:formylglycine-generating enzyme required for sulfatase activity
MFSADWIGRTTVTNREFEEFLELSKYFNCEFTPI